jgi:hypothetical protein
MMGTDPLNKFLLPWRLGAEPTIRTDNEVRRSKVALDVAMPAVCSVGFAEGFKISEERIFRRGSGERRRS